ncbi:MAG: hypothetical protein R3A52_02545 [Polyangiales bacterium]
MSDFKDPDELIFFSRKSTENELKKQEGFAVIKNVAAKLLGWSEEVFGALGDHAREGDAPPPPPPPPPEPRDIAAVLGSWTFAEVPVAAAKVPAASGATLSTPGEAFPRWHVGGEVLAEAERVPYTEAPGPKARGAASNAGYTSDRTLEVFRHELAYEEYRARNLEPLYWHQRRYQISSGFKLPFVYRLKRELGDEKTRAIVSAVKGARAKLPELPTEGKGAGRFAWTKWTGLGKDTRPLVGEGWMFAEDTRSDYARWLYQEWFKGYADNLKSPARLPHMAALKTLYQEGAPSSLNTYDSCIMTWGVGFACGAPQIVAQLLGNANIMNALYACGFSIQGFEKDGVLPTIPGFHYQTLDLSDADDPKVLVWDNFNHFYGRAPGANGAEITIRPRRTDPLPKGKPAPPVVEDESDPVARIRKRFLKYTVAGANPQPQANLELSYHIYNHMTLKDSSETAILKAFVAIARDPLTREAVSEANRTLIVNRAVLAPSLSVIQTEAAYTFVSMCKHNWGLTNAQLEMSSLEKHLVAKERALLKKWQKALASTPAGEWNTKFAGDPDSDFDYARDAGCDNARHAMIFHDAIIAKAVARRVMSVLEWDRLEQAKKRFLKAERDGAPTTVKLLDERLRKYSLLWRFDRLQEYWRDMTTGHNWLVPMRQAQSIAGVTSPEVAARLKARPVESIHYSEVPLSVPIKRFGGDGQDNFSMAGSTSTPPNWRGAAYYAPFRFAIANGAPDLKGSTFFNLGDRRLMLLPQVVERYGQHLELIGVDVDASDSKKTRLRWKRVPVGEVTLEDQLIIVSDYAGAVIEEMK